MGLWNYNNYLKFCKKNKLNFKIIDNSKLGFEVKNIQGGIQVKEPIYDWEIIKKEAKSIINQFERNKIHLNEEVKKMVDLSTSEKIILWTLEYQLFFLASIHNPFLKQLMYQ